MSLFSDKTWGGMVLTGTGDSYALAVSEILNRGFRIVGEDPAAGMMRIWVTGTSESVRDMQEAETRQRLPALFFPIPAGAVADLSLVKRWTNRPSDVVGAAL